MVWAKIDDKYAEHPKVVAAGEEAAWVNVKAILWSCRFLTDGFIPEEAAHVLASEKPLMSPSDGGFVQQRAPKEPRKRPHRAPEEPRFRQIIARLTREFHGRSGLWKPATGGYLIHDFLEYNPSKEAVEAERKASRLRQERFRERRNGQFGNGEETVESQRYGKSGNAVGHGSVTSTPSRPSPSQPSPSPSLSPTPSPARPDTRHGAPDGGGNENPGVTPETWAGVLEDLRGRVEPADFDRYLGRSYQVGIDPVGRLVIHVPDRAAARWITDFHFNAIEESLARRVSEPPPEVRFEASGG